MGDLQFAKQFLTSIDNKPTKYQPDHIFDPKEFQITFPYTLPKLSTPPHPPPPKSTSTPSAPGAERATPSITLVLKSARNPNMIFTISSISPSATSLQSVKEQVQSYLGGSGVVNVEKIKLLLKKKPIAGSKKTIADALEGSSAIGEVELGVMVMGGAPDPPPQTIPPPAADASIAASAPPSEKATVEAQGKRSEATPMEGVETAKTEPVQPGEASGESILETSEFWNDLQGFLEQRIKSEEVAKKLRVVFEKAWSSSKAAP